MTPNDKLPEVIRKQIRKEAKEYSKQYSTATSEVDWYNGATAWAGWKVKYEELKADFIDLGKRYNTAQATMTEQAIETALHKERNAIQAKITSMEVEYLKQIYELADALGKISNIASWMEETGASRISEIAETALKQRNLGEAEKKEQLIPMAIYKQQGSKTEGKAATDPCPHCGKELSRDRNLCCRECGKEVEG